MTLTPPRHRPGPGRRCSSALRPEQEDQSLLLMFAASMEGRIRKPWVRGHYG